MARTIRLAHPDDASTLHAIYVPFVVNTPISFELVPPTEQEMRQRIEQTVQTHPWLVCEEQGEILGYAYASQHRTRQAYQWSVDVSAYVHERWRRKGIGKALYTSLFALLQLQGFYNVYAGIALPNPASVALHEAMGMRQVGVYSQVGYKLGVWHDVGWWQQSLQSHGLEPVPPLELESAQKLAGWEEALMSGMALFDKEIDDDDSVAT
jgi:L-amino acid N-acyltransferase YncA